MKLIQPFGTDAYEDPTKADPALNPNSPHIHVIANGDHVGHRDMLPMDTEEINPEDITHEAFGANGDQLYVYSDASVIDGGRKGTGAWHMKGDKIQRQTRIYPADRPLSSTRAELLTALKCLLTLRDKYTGKIRLALDNLSVVRKFNMINTDYPASYWGKDPDLWTSAHRLLCLEKDCKDIELVWVRGHADKIGKPLTDDQKENIKADKATNEAYALPEADGISGTHPSIAHFGSQEITIEIMGKPVTGPLNISIMDHICMELYQQYQDGKGHYNWSKGIDYGLRRRALRIAPFKSKPARMTDYRVTQHYNLFHGRHATLHVKARRLGLTSGQNCPWCHETDTTAHTITRCRKKEVAEARRQFLKEMQYTIMTAKNITLDTRKALSALYSCQQDGSMTTLSHTTDLEVTKVVNCIIKETAKTQEPLRPFYRSLWEMEATDRALAWFRRDWIYELTKIKGNTVDGAEALGANLIRTASKAHKIWTTRCRELHLHSSNDPVDYIEAAAQYDSELKRTKKVKMAISRHQFLDMNRHQRIALLQAWTQFPSAADSDIRAWITSGSLGKRMPFRRIILAPSVHKSGTTHRSSGLIKIHPQYRQSRIPSFFPYIQQGIISVESTLPTPSQHQEPQNSDMESIFIAEPRTSFIEVSGRSKRQKIQRETTVRRRLRNDVEYHSAINHNGIVYLDIAQEIILRKKRSKPGLSDTDKSVGELDPPKPPNLRVVRFRVHLRDT